MVTPRNNDPVLLPVIDLRGGVVVRGVAGQRHLYRPVVSQLAPSSEPLPIASAFARLGFRDVYVADLDAIAGGPPAWQDYRTLAATGLRLWLDAGAASPEMARRVMEWEAGAKSLEALIVGTESLRNADDLLEILAIARPERVVLSIDLRGGELVAAAEAWHRARPLEVVQATYDWGCRRFLVLDVAAVGMANGTPTHNLCRTMKAQYPQIQLVSGGGVRDAADVVALTAVGCDRVLVATALHDRRLP